MKPLLQLTNPVVQHVLIADLERLKRLGNRRAVLIAELSRINTEIQETAKAVSETSNGLYERSVYWN